MGFRNDPISEKKKKKNGLRWKKIGNIGYRIFFDTFYCDENKKKNWQAFPKNRIALISGNCFCFVLKVFFKLGIKQTFVQAIQTKLKEEKTC